MKTRLTIEESAQLIELGIDQKMASEWEIVDTTDENDPNSFLDYEEYPIFSLTNLLSILPKEIEDSVLGMEYDSEFKQWWAGYNAVSLKSAPELIDALNSLLIWVLENNLNQEKQ